APGLTVIIEAVLLADLPGPAVVRGGGVAVGGEKGLRGGRIGGRGGQGEKAALANLFLVFAGCAQGPGHGGVRAGGERPGAAKKSWGWARVTAASFGWADFRWLAMSGQAPC